MADVPGPEHDELVYESAGLPKTTNWWGAFVIGLAGTILVTGIAPVMVTELGAASVPVIVVITISGYIVCLLLAELSAMMPDRSGGLPAYAYPAYKDKWPRFAEHVNGFSAWAYWLGWFPVAPLNMILASFYIVDRFKLNATAGITPIHTLIAWWTLGIAIVGILLLAIPAVRGLRFGTAFATTLALLSMIPLTFLAIAWIFNPSVVDFGQLWHFRHTDGSGFFTPLFGHGWLTLYIAFSFLLTWNVIAMEAAACYIGETKNPDRDAKIAMNLEGLYGLFIYTMIPVAFIIVLGLSALGNAALVDPQTIFVHYAADVFGAGTGSNILEWLIAIMLILALILSALNAITGHRALASPDVDRRAVPALLPARQQARRAEPGDVVQRGLLDRSWCSWAAPSRSTRSRTSATWPRSSRCWSATTCCESTVRTCGGRSSCPSG